MDLVPWGQVLPRGWREVGMTLAFVLGYRVLVLPLLSPNPHAAVAGLSERLIISLELLGLSLALLPIVRLVSWRLVGDRA